MGCVQWDPATLLSTHFVKDLRNSSATPNSGGDDDDDDEGKAVKKFVGCVNCIDFTSKSRREQNLLDAAKIDDGWKETVDKDKEVINKVFTDKLQPLIDGNRENALVVTLDGSNLYTSTCLVRNAGLPSKNILVPAPFNGKHNKTIKRRGNQDLKDVKISKLFLYDLILQLDPNNPLVAIFLDYCGTFTGNKYSRPLLDIELLFRRQLLCSAQFPEAYLMVTFCARNPNGGAVGLGGRYGETTLPIVEIGLMHGYIVTQCYTHAYGSAMYVIGYYVRSFRFPVTIGYRLSPGGINSKLSYLKSPILKTKPTSKTSIYLYPSYGGDDNQSSSLSLTDKSEKSEVGDDESSDEYESEDEDKNSTATSSNDSNVGDARSVALAKLADQTRLEIAQTRKSVKIGKGKDKYKCKMQIVIKGKNGKDRHRECKNRSAINSDYCHVHEVDEPLPTKLGKRKYDQEIESALQPRSSSYSLDSVPPVKRLFAILRREKE